MDEHITRVYEKYPKDNDIWLLLQDVVCLKQDVQKLKDQMDEAQGLIDKQSQCVCDLIETNARLIRLIDKKK